VTSLRPTGWLGLPPGSCWPERDTPYGHDLNPFIRYRHLLWSYNVAIQNGLEDSGYVEMVRRLDNSIAEVDGNGFRITPLLPLNSLSQKLDKTVDLWAKDETRNVAGSHKARHLFGLALHLEITSVPNETPLTIASCGNAALGAAVVARATNRPLVVHVPVWADPIILKHLKDLEADVRICEREKGEKGDPCVRQARQLVAKGAIPFTCQGTENLLTIDGGRTLGFELADQLALAEIDNANLFIQVGGGALASSCVQALTDAVELGRLSQRPQLYPVQAEGCAPLARAFNLAVNSIDPFQESHMWPWQDPTSLATGILDDITYDWKPIVATLLEDGTIPVVAQEAEIAKAHYLVRSHTKMIADPTGSSSVAGLLAALRIGCVRKGARVITLITGVERQPTDNH